MTRFGLRAAPSEQRKTMSENKLEKPGSASVSDLQRLVSHSFTDDELQDMALSCVPFAVQVRNILNSVGFKFEDDGKPSLIINYAQTPLGIMKCWRDEATRTTTYEQIIPAG